MLEIRVRKNACGQLLLLLILPGGGSLALFDANGGVLPAAAEIDAR